jgi:hypothetical protein
MIGFKNRSISLENADLKSLRDYFFDLMLFFYMAVINIY